MPTEIRRQQHYRIQSFMLSDSREGILFPESGSHKKINGNDILKMMGLAYLLHGCQKGHCPRTDGKQGHCRCSSNRTTLISLLVSRVSCLLNVH